MFSCHANDKKNKNSMKKSINSLKDSKNDIIEDDISNNPDNLKKMDENSLIKLKTLLNKDYQNSYLKEIEYHKKLHLKDEQNILEIICNTII